MKIVHLVHLHFNRLSGKIVVNKRENDLCCDPKEASVHWTEELLPSLLPLTSHILSLCSLSPDDTDATDTTDKDTTEVTDTTDKDTTDTTDTKTLQNRHHIYRHSHHRGRGLKAVYKIHIRKDTMEEESLQFTQKVCQIISNESAFQGNLTI